MAEPAFLAWCREQGISLHGVAPGFVAQGWRGVVATQHVPAGAVVMRVPERLLMSALSARRDPQLAAVLDQHQLTSHQVRRSCSCSRLRRTREVAACRRS